jgi:hypothetical protein
MPITASVLKKWNNENVFLVSYSKNDYLQNEAKTKLNLLLIDYQDKKEDTVLDILALNTLHSFFEVFNLKNTASYNQINQAIEVYFAQFFQTSSQEKNENKNEIDWVIKYFHKFSSSRIVKELNLHQQVIDVLLTCSAIKPMHVWTYYLDGMISLYWTERDADAIGFRQKTVEAYCKNFGFKTAFIYSYLATQGMHGLKKHNELFAKIISCPESLEKGIEIAATLYCLNNYTSSDPRLIENFLNTKLIAEYPQHSSSLFRIFSHIGQRCTSLAQLFHKIMNQDVLNNLAIVENYVFSNQKINQLGFSVFNWINPDIRDWQQRIENLLDDLIMLGKWSRSTPEFINQSNSPFMMLANEMNLKIISETFTVLSFKQVTQATKSFSPWTYRLSFPLSDKMLAHLDSEDIAANMKNIDDLKIALSDIKFDQFKYIFNNLSSTSLSLLLNKLGRPFVIEHFFEKHSAMFNILSQLSLECQKTFICFLGKELLFNYFTDPEKNGLWYLNSIYYLDKNNARDTHVNNDNIEKNTFQFLLEYLGSSNFIYEVIYPPTLTKIENNVGEGHWCIQDCYQLLAHVATLDTELLETSFKRLREEWLHLTNKNTSIFYNNLYPGTGVVKFQFDLLDKIGANHLKTLFYDFEQLSALFKFDNRSTTRLKILDMLGNEHIKQLRISIHDIS